MRSLIYICAGLLVSLVAFGQSTPPSDGFGTTSLTADLSPLNLVPPLQGRAESGTAEVEITLVQATTGGPESAVVSFDIGLENGLAADITGFAIHEGVAGQNGPALIQTQLPADGQAPAGDTISGQMMITSSSQLEALQAVVQTPEGFYVLLTGTSNPDGLLRGQLSEDGDMSGEMDNLSDRLERIEKQLNVIQRMVRSVGGVLGIDPSFLPEPEVDTEGNGGDTSNPVNP